MTRKYLNITKVGLEKKNSEPCLLITDMTRTLEIFFVDHFLFEDFESKRLEAS